MMDPPFFHYRIPAVAAVRVVKDNCCVSTGTISMDATRECLQLDSGQGGDCRADPEGADVCR